LARKPDQAIAIIARPGTYRRRRCADKICLIKFGTAAADKVYAVTRLAAAAKIDAACRGEQTTCRVIDRQGIIAAAPLKVKTVTPLSDTGAPPLSE